MKFLTVVRQRFNQIRDQDNIYKMSRQLSIDNYMRRTIDNLEVGMKKRKNNKKKLLPVPSNDKSEQLPEGSLQQKARGGMIMIVGVGGMETLVGMFLMNVEANKETMVVRKHASLSND